MKLLDSMIKEGRAWLYDCGSRVPENDIHLVLKVNRDYDGGWPEFVRADPDANQQEVYDEVERRYPGAVLEALYPAGDPTPTGDPGLILG